MAEGKTSFVLYCDIIHTVEHLTDEQAGKLMKHLLRYVNDQDPVVEDVIINLAFEPIKRQLKRDLQAWEQSREKRVESGRLGGIKSGKSRKSKQTKQVLQKTKQNEANASNAKQTQANEAVNVNVTVTGNVREREPHTQIWNQRPGEESRNLELPKNNGENVIQFLRLTKGAQVTPQQVLGLWEVFKIQYFTGQKFYASPSDTYSHFLNWSKGQPIEKIESGGGKISAPPLKTLEP